MKSSAPWDHEPAVETEAAVEDEGEGDGVLQDVLGQEADVAVADPVSQLPPEQELCTVVGPFSNLAQADILVEQLAGLAVPASLQKVEVPVKKNFWLYLEPMASKADALKKLAELQAQKIDSYIIPKGDLINGISIGVFVESHRAEFRQNELAELGYDVKVRVDIRTAEQSYVVAKAQSAVNVSAATWAQLLEGGDNVTYKQNYCSDVASLH